MAGSKKALKYASGIFVILVITPVTLLLILVYWYSKAWPRYPYPRDNQLYYKEMIARCPESVWPIYDDYGPVTSELRVPYPENAPRGDYFGYACSRNEAFSEIEFIKEHQ